MVEWLTPRRASAALRRATPSASIGVAVLRRMPRYCRHGPTASSYCVAIAFAIWAMWFTLTRRDAFAKLKPESKYANDVRLLVQQLLRDSTVPRDSLPYTNTFDDMKRAYESARQETIADHAFWVLLDKIGKYGGLKAPGGRKKGSRAPKLSDNEQLEVLRLLPEGIGTRDHLPYTERFNDMHRRFGRSTGKTLDKHEFWRAVSLVAKNARKPKPVHEAAPIGSLTPELVAFLEDNNPWWRGKPMRSHPTFPRWAFAEVVSRLHSRMAPIVVVRGSRRVGKSVLQEQRIEELLLAGKSDPTRKSVEAARILRVQFDDAPLLGGISMPIQAIIRWYEEHVLGHVNKGCGFTANAAAALGRGGFMATTVTCPTNDVLTHRHGCGESKL